jgi:hypothetical protein
MRTFEEEVKTKNHLICPVLNALKTVDGDGKAYFTSGKVNSMNKRGFLYGKVGVRVGAVA